VVVVTGHRPRSAPPPTSCSARWPPPSWRCARRFQPLRSILTEIYLCHACSYHEISRVETPEQVNLSQEDALSTMVGPAALRARAADAWANYHTLVRRAVCVRTWPCVDCGHEAEGATTAVHWPDIGYRWPRWSWHAGAARAAARRPTPRATAAGCTSSCSRCRHAGAGRGGCSQPARGVAPPRRRVPRFCSLATGCPSTS
jgi:hypothetical protein